MQGCKNIDFFVAASFAPSGPFLMEKNICGTKIKQQKSELNFFFFSAQFVFGVSGLFWGFFWFVCFFPFDYQTVAFSKRVVCSNVLFQCGLIRILDCVKSF